MSEQEFQSRTPRRGVAGQQNSHGDNSREQLTGRPRTGLEWEAHPNLETDQFWAILEHLPAAIYATDAAGRLTFYNEAAAALWGRRPKLGGDKWCGSWRLFWPDGRPLAHDESPVAVMLKSGQPVGGVEAIAERPDGTRAACISYPRLLRDASGEISGAINMLVEITDRKKTEEALRERETQLKARIRQLAAVSGLGMLALVTDDLQDLFDVSAERLAQGLDVELASVLELEPRDERLLLRAGAGWWDGMVGHVRVFSGAGSQAGYTLSTDRPVIVEDLKSDTRFTPARGLVDNGIVSGLSVVIRGEGEAPFGVLSAHTRTSRRFSADDVHFLESVANILTAALQRRAFRDRQSMMTDELSHRVKNILTVIQAMASQTGRGAASVDDFLDTFEGRLHALSRAHDTLMKSHWAGASLEDLVEFVVASQVTKEQLHFDLENLTLDPSCTQAMAMVLHELLTNAAKHGALSDGRGTITLVGRNTKIDGNDVYRLSWHEHGGPPVTKPVHGGFGSELIAGMVTHQCGGDWAIDWRRDGVSVDFTLPLPAENDK